MLLMVRRKTPVLLAFRNDALTVISPVTSLSSSERSGTVATISLPNDGNEDGYIVQTPIRSSALARSNTPMWTGFVMSRIATSNSRFQPAGDLAEAFGNHAHETSCRIAIPGADPEGTCRIFKMRTRVEPTIGAARGSIERTIRVATLTSPKYTPSFDSIVPSFVKVELDAASLDCATPLPVVLVTVVPDLESLSISVYPDKVESGFNFDLPAKVNSPFASTFTFDFIFAFLGDLNNLNLPLPSANGTPVLWLILKKLDLEFLHTVFGIPEQSMQNRPILTFFAPSLFE